MEFYILAQFSFSLVLLGRPVSGSWLKTDTRSQIRYVSIFLPSDRRPETLEMLLSGETKCIIYSYVVRHPRTDNRLFPIGVGEGHATQFNQQAAEL